MENQISAKKLILRTFGYLLITLVGAYFLSWAVAEGFFAVSDLNYRFNPRRYAQVLNYLKTDEGNKPLHLVIGASEVETGFRPDIFDEEMKQTGNSPFASLNLGFRGMSPLMFKKLCARLLEMSAQTGRRYKLISVSFVADRHTKKARSTLFSKLFDRDILAEVTSYPMLKKDFLDSPKDALPVAMNKFFFHSQKDATVLTLAQVIFSQIGIKIFHRSHLAEMPPNAIFATLWYNRLFNFDPAWNPAYQGFNNWGLPRSAPYLLPILKNYQESAAINEELLKRYQDQFEIQDLDFSDEYLDLTSEGLRSLKTISDHVELINIPLNPIIPFSPGAKDRLETALQKIAHSADVPVLDYEKISLENNDFIDILHLSFKGGEKFSRAFAQDVRSRFYSAKNEDR